MAVFAGAVVILATERLWSLHRQALRHQQAEDLLAFAIRAEQAGEYASARCVLATLPDVEPDVARRIAPLEQRLRLLEQHREFLARADAAVADGAHRLDDSGAPDPIVGRCDEAFNSYRGLEELIREQRDEATGLNPAQAAQARHRAAEVMTVLSLRLLVQDSRTPDERAALRRALALVDEAEELAAASHAIAALRSALHRRLGAIADADRAAEYAAQTPPRSALDHYVVGFLAEQIDHDGSAAAAAYSRALALAPEYYPAHAGCYTIARSSNDGPAQVAALTACLALRPHEAPLHFHRGLARFQLNDYFAALEDLNTCLRGRPEHSLAHYWRGRIHCLAARWNDAEADFTAALAQDAKMGAAYAGRGLARAHLGRDRDAVADAELATRSTRDAETTLQAARVYGLCSRLAGKDARGAARAEEYGARAVAVLRDAVTRGLTRRPGGREALLANPDLDAVRGRPDFEDLLRSVETRAGHRE
ncbi:hypothetical protein AYO40_04880 [Planctomycetaceae bacterium SCGC AG-212-D15]|nr:hypothetical protein AYO40_04880 [Planctomycetaceae bacterium SCGC AG-212-D15]